MKTTIKVKDALKDFNQTDTDEIREMEASMKFFDQLVEQGIATHRGYRLQSIEQRCCYTEQRIMF